MPPLPDKLASRHVNSEYLQDLEVLENQVYPLQGASGPRSTRDPRLQMFVGAPMAKLNELDMVCYYEHMTTLRHKKTGTLYVIFRETRDAQMAQQNDPVKYPKWLMDHAVKDDERAIYIHIAKPNAVQLLKKGVSNIGEWLDPISEPWQFDAIAYFLLKSGLWTEKMYGSFR